MLRVVTTEPEALVEIDLSDLSPEIQSGLAALFDIEARYESDRDSLEGWNGPEAAKERLLDLLEARHRREREPLVQQLAELHQSMIMASMFRHLPVAH